MFVFVLNLFLNSIVGKSMRKKNIALAAVECQHQMKYLYVLIAFLLKKLIYDFSFKKHSFGQERHIIIYNLPTAF